MGRNYGSLHKKFKLNLALLATGLVIIIILLSQVSTQAEVPIAAEANDGTPPATPPHDTTPPAVPGEFQVANPGNGTELVISWQASPEPDTAGYLLYRATQAGGEFTLLTRIEDGQATGYTDQSVDRNQQYWYQIASSDDLDNTSAVTTVVEAVALDTCAPAMPAVMTARDARTGGRVDLQWAANSEEDLEHYLIYRSEGDDQAQQVGVIPAGTSSYADTGLTDGVAYSYQLSAVDSSGNQSSLTGAVTAIPGLDVTPPAAPDGLEVRDSQTGGLLELGWASNQESDLAGYQLYRAESEAGPYLPVGPGLLLGTGYSDNEVADNITYYYYLAAVDAVGNVSELSPGASAVPTHDTKPPQVPTELVEHSDTTPPALPAGLMAGNPRTGSLLELNWAANNEPDLAGYLLYRAGHEAGPYQNVIQGLIASTSYRDSDVANNVTYYYKLAAVDQSGNASPFTAIVSAVPTHDTTPPAIPQQFQITNPGTGTELLLSWQASPELDAAGYLLYRRDQEDGEFKLLARIAKIDETAFTDQGVARNQQYWYQIAGFDDLGNVTEDLVAVAAQALDISPPAIPLVLTVLDPLTGMELHLNWEANPEPDLAGYNLYRGSESTGDFIMLNREPLVGTAYIDQELEQGKLYYYRLTAVDTTGNETRAISSGGVKPFRGAAVSVLAPGAALPHHLRMELSNSVLFRNTSNQAIAITVYAEDELGQPVAVSGTWKLLTGLGLVSELATAAADSARGLLECDQLGSGEIVVMFIPGQPDAMPVQAETRFRSLEWYVELELEPDSPAAGDLVQLLATVTDHDGNPVTDPGVQVSFQANNHNYKTDQLEKPGIGRYQVSGRAYPVNAHGIPLGMGRPDARGRVAGRLQTSTVPGINQVEAILKFNDLQAPGAGLHAVDNSGYQEVIAEPGSARYVGWQPEAATITADHQYEVKLAAFDAYGNITDATGNLQVSIQSPASGHVDFSLDGGRTWAADYLWYPVELGSVVRFRLPARSEATLAGSFAYLLVRIDIGSDRLSPPPGVNQANQPFYIRMK